MSYRVFILKRAQKELSELSVNDYRNIKAEIMKLSGNPRPHDCKKLIARNGWRIRVGHYRVIYEINDKEKFITVLHTGHRKDVYQ